jgi:hypothetical protein
MLASLAWKESREVAPLMALALVVQMYLLGAAIGVTFIPYVDTRGVIPFVNDFAGVLLVIVGGLAAIALGLWQTTRESSGGTFPFLLHRPVARETIFAAKLLTGLTAYLIVAGVPLALYTLWAATPRTHASPFYWSLAASNWGAVMGLPLVYLGAFLAGLRPGRWVGSRLLPLVGSGFAWGMAQWLGMLTGSLWIGGLALAAVAVCLVTATFHVARTRDYS